MYWFAIELLCFSFKLHNFIVCWWFWVFSCLYVSIRRPHNLASIHHYPPPSHPCRPHRSFRHPHLRPHTPWQQRYSTVRHISTGPSTPSFTFPSCASATQFSQRFLLPCERSFYFCYSNFMSRVQGSLSHCIQKGFLLSKYSIYCPLGISETSVLLCPQTSKKQMSGPAENVWPQETSHHHSKRCVCAQIILILKALFQRVNFGVWCARQIHFWGVWTL